MSRRSRPCFVALSAPLEPTRQAEVAQLIEKLLGPGALLLCQEKHSHFLAGVTRLYTEEFQKGGHDRAQRVLLEKLQIFASRHGIAVPAATHDDALQVQLCWGPKSQPQRTNFAMSGIWHIPQFPG